MQADPKIEATINAQMMRRALVLEQLVTATRGLIPTLKDHNLSNTSKEFERLIFEYDAIMQELEQLAGANPRGFLETILAKMQRK